MVCTCRPSDITETSTNIQRKPDIKNEASALVDVMGKLETGIMTAFWYKVLNRINDNSKILQSGTIDLTTAVKLLQSLSEFLVSQRSQFNYYLKKGHSIFWEWAFRRKTKKETKTLS